ncbi:MAG: TetR/AcrR family transcriptional regulator [Planctomycetota bacterium]|nr:TetR/AcrR family transcriptional regulator [Planctomycetota bacterium]
MQRPDEKKRQKITATAAKLFATRPFHEVRLDDVAAAAQVGKGTLYIYFKSKEDLYRSLIHDGVMQIMEQLSQSITNDLSPGDALEKTIRLMVTFAYAHPYLFELMRAIDSFKGRESLLPARRQLIGFIEQVLRRGADQQSWTDPHPQLTAVFIPGLIRSAILYGPKDIKEKALADQILRLFRHGLQKETFR